MNQILTNVIVSLRWYREKYVIFLKSVVNSLGSTFKITTAPYGKHQRQKSPHFNVLLCVPKDFSEGDLFAQQDGFFKEL